jgi:16S rRNA (uracil1498-N3)-methyltransferase
VAVTIALTKPRILLKEEDVKGDGCIIVQGERAHYLTRVLRIAPGRTFVGAVPEGDELEVEVLEVRQERVMGKVVGAPQRIEQPGPPVYVALAILKRKAMEWAVQKLAELGAGGVIPLLTQRGVVKTPAAHWSTKVERWRQIAMEAVRQCRGVTAPDVAMPTSVKQLGEMLATGQVRWLVLDPQAPKDHALRDALNSGAPEGAGIIVGPEGDFTDDEKQILIGAGALPVSLGPRVLRSETAAVVACALVMHLLSELG